MVEQLEKLGHRQTPDESCERRSVRRESWLLVSDLSESDTQTGGGVTGTRHFPPHLMGKVVMKGLLRAPVYDCGLLPEFRGFLHRKSCSWKDVEEFFRAGHIC